MVSTTEAGPSGVGSRMPYLMRDYTAETFLPYAGQVFMFEAVQESGNLGLQLSQVSRRRAGKVEGFREPFSLLFTLSSGDPSIGGLYRIAHRDFVSCEWFVSRVFVMGADPSVPHYEAVFG